MNMLPRLKPRCFYDLVIEVAIVRPGPIQGDMVHPYLKRRSGKEPVTFPCPDPEHGPPDELEKILGRTLGVPIFQEQAMKIALDAAKFSSDEANQLRKAMATFRSQREHRGARRTRWSGGWSSAATTPTSPSAASTRSRASANMASPKATRRASRTSSTCRAGSSGNIRRPSPAALLNSQPMGFYAPAQIVRDAREHGVEVREVDVNHSDWDCTLEDGALRLGLRQVDGLQREAAERLVARGGPTATVEELRSARRRAGACDPAARRGRRVPLDGPRPARGAVGLARAQAGAGPAAVRLCRGARRRRGKRARAASRRCRSAEHVVNDYQTIRLSLKAHPMRFLREHYAAQKFVTADQLEDHPRRQAAVDRRAGADPPAAGQRQGRRASSPSRTRPASPTSSSGPTCSKSSARSSWARG